MVCSIILKMYTTVFDAWSWPNRPHSGIPYQVRDVIYVAFVMLWHAPSYWWCIQLIFDALSWHALSYWWCIQFISDALPPANRPHSGIPYQSRDGFYVTRAFLFHYCHLFSTISFTTKRRYQRRMNHFCRSINFSIYMENGFYFLGYDPESQESHYASIGDAAAFGQLFPFCELLLLDPKPRINIHRSSWKHICSY